MDIILAVVLSIKLAIEAWLFALGMFNPRHPIAAAMWVGIEISLKYPVLYALKFAISGAIIYGAAHINLMWTAFMLSCCLALDLFSVLYFILNRKALN
jgi:hypothetical protein